ncbi:hypothetical protein IMCC3135_32755 [Granulosicoccus antarcticus IMCC3135]|uniref:DUF11 domain-containing protein n=2 Tax=Granulosicoccus TaxID=437504 RepID=A0A2Z2NYS2_9GAMM|nr:hypothetical protein IMCC3135_32755 [Granulosicoccus antarcticus IMCC3135]
MGKPINKSGHAVLSGTSVQAGFGSCVRIICMLAIVLLLLPSGKVLAEGSWQLGMFEGPTHTQIMTETNTGTGTNVLYVDILSATEVINIHACGLANNHRIQVEIFDAFGSSLYAPASRTATAQNFSCSSDLNTTFDPAVTNPFQFTAPVPGTYEIRLSNLDHSYLNLVDVTVTSSTSDIIDPRANGGRLWSTNWDFNANGYGDDVATDADMYVVSDGGFSGTYYIWQLDLNNFAGFAYTLKANDLGVNSPNTAGDVVAGISVPRGGNSVSDLYPIYVAYPEKDFPRPTNQLIVSNFYFSDEEGVDGTISPGDTSGSQDYGFFHFTSNTTSSAVYEIVIDTGDGAGGGPDGIFGLGDIFLRGNAVFGENEVGWNGTDNNGVLIPVGSYSSQMTLRSGEFHFVSDDVETSGGAGNVGLKINEAVSTFSSIPTVNYWDDYTVLNGTEPNAFNVNGTYDADHNWGDFTATSFGDQTYIDTYAFGDSVSPEPIAVGIVESDEARPSISKAFTPDIVTVGTTSVMSFEITNNGITALTGINFTDALPTGLVLAEVPTPISISGTGCTGYTTSPTTTAGGSSYDIISGTLPGSGTCTIEIDVQSSAPGDYNNTTSGVGSLQAGVSPASNTATLTVVPAASGPPFVCDSTFYVDAGGATSTRLYTVNRDAGTYALEEFTGINYAPTSGYAFNALGFNPVDEYLYAIVTDSTLGNSVAGTLLRIDSEGAITDLAVAEPGPTLAYMPAVNTRFRGGAFDEAGLFYIITDAGGTSPLDERSQIMTVDVSSFPTLVVARATHGLDIQDVAVHENGTVYAYETGAGLVTIDPETGAVTNIGGSFAGEVGSLFFDSRNDLFMSVDDGTYYRVDLSTGATSFVANGTAATLHDGASCNYGVDFEKSVEFSQVEAGGTATYIFSLVNQTDGALSFDLSDSLTDGRTYVAGSLQNALGGSANTYADTGNFILTGVALPANSVEEIRIDVRFPGEFPLGTVYNQALLSNLPANLGTTMVSDLPGTAPYESPTPVTVIGRPLIGAAKAVAVAGSVVTLDFVLENPGASDLSDVALTDDLDAVFGAGNYIVSAAPAFIIDPGTLTLNAGFTGNGAQTNLLDSAGSNTLLMGATARIRIEVTVINEADLGNGPGVYSNQASAAADTSLGTRIGDLSDDGPTPDTDGDGDPTEDIASGGDSDENDPSVFTISFSDALSGVVFIDNGSGGATPHDALPTGGEQGYGSITVQALDPLNGNAVVASTQTAPDGSYTLEVPPSLPVTISMVPPSGYLLIAESVGDSGASNANITDGQLSFTPAAATDYSGLNFGLVKQPTLQPDQVASTTPGSAVVLSHVFRAESSGNVTFAFADIINDPATDGWTRTLYLDSDCDGQQGSGDSPLSGTSSVSADGVSLICLLVKVSAPANAPPGALATHALVATTVFSDPAATGHGVTSTQRVNDSVRVAGTASGKLVLRKVVVNVTQGSPESTLGGNALPGDVLRYVIRFENTGVGSITDLRINDGMPAFSFLDSTIVCPGSLPVTLTSCTLALPAAVDNQNGYVGNIQWAFDGALAPGASGEVQYDTVVE